jgi:predicted amidophosphoribosyltransferase
MSVVTTNNYYREWNAPFWSLLLLCAALPVLRVGLAVRRRRVRRSGLCAVCGYDLRATPERCPECGAVVE